MKQTVTCQHCGASLESDQQVGLCPSCLLQAGIDLSDSAFSESESDPSADTAPELPYRFGDYELLERVARGGMGVVYKARQLSLNRIVAVKMILAGELASSETVLRFRAEAESAANLRHPHIVAIYETGEADGQHYFSMEYIEGRNLAQMVSDGPLTAERAAQYIEKVANAVEYAHQQGILHRDLKPSNVLIDTRDEPRVTDFGLAKKLTYDSALTLSGQVVGSPNFMPPEQASSKRGKVGRQSDVYGLGALLYHLLTGSPPFQAPSLEETLSQVFEMEPVSPRTLNPGVPRDLETICLKCLDKEPPRRYPTAKAVADELHAFLRREPIQARPLGPSGKLWRWCRRKPMIATLSTAVLLLLLTLAIGGPIAAEHNRRLTYTSDLSTAWLAWKFGNVTRSNALLDRHVPELGQSDLREFTWRYLWNLGLPAENTPSIPCGHHVFNLDISPDGRMVAASGPYRNVTLWDIQTHELVQSIDTGEKAFFPEGVFSPDGQTLVTTGGNHRQPCPIQIWDIDTGVFVAEPNIPHLASGGVAGRFSPDGESFALAGGAPVTEIVILDISRGWLDATVKNRWPAHRGGTSQVNWSPDGRYLVSTGHDHMVRFWDAESDDPLSQPRWRMELGGLVTAARFCPTDSHLFATSSEDSSVRFWEAITFTEIVNDRYEHATQALALDWSQDGRWIASAGAGGLVHVRQLETQREWSLRGHSRGVAALAFVPDYSALITATVEGSIRFWDLDDLPPNDVLEGKAHRGLHYPMAFSPDSLTIVTTDHEAASILTWDVATGEALAQFPIPASDLVEQSSVTLEEISGVEAMSMAFVSESLLAVACKLVLIDPDPTQITGIVAIYDLESGQLIDSFEGIAPIQPTPDGKRLAFQGPKPDRFFYRDLADGTITPIPHLEPAVRGSYVGAYDFSPDGKILAVSVSGAGHADERKLYLLEASTGKRLNELKAETYHSPTSAIGFTPDGEWLLTSGLVPKVQFWDVRTGDRVDTLEGHASSTTSLAISPDGKTLVTGSKSGVVKFWSLTQMVELLTIQISKTRINSLRFSPDGNTLASGSQDGTVRLFRAVPEP